MVKFCQIFLKLFPLTCMIALYGGIYLILVPKSSLKMAEDSKLIWTSKFNEISNQEAEFPLILGYAINNKNRSLFTYKAINALANCPYQCRWSDNVKLYPIASAVIFKDLQLIQDPRLLPKGSNPDRLNIFYSREAPIRFNFRANFIPADFFNLTMTYRLDSTIFKPYERFIEINDYGRNNGKSIWTEDQIEAALKKKTKLAIAVISNCNTPSKRELYLQKLRHYANLTLLGKCYNDAQPRGTNTFFTKNTEEFLKSHFFYLAFENSVCKNYISEKFWRIKNLIVPVVLKRSILKGIVGDEYFIAVDDFSSPKALADRLIFLSKNMTEYKKYLGWTKKYKRDNGFDEREMCKICEMATKKEKHFIRDIYEWWEDKGECEAGFAEQFL